MARDRRVACVRVELSVVGGGWEFGLVPDLYLYVEKAVPAQAGNDEKSHQRVEVLVILRLSFEAEYEGNEYMYSAFCGHRALGSGAYMVLACVHVCSCEVRTLFRKGQSTW